MLRWRREVRLGACRHFAADDVFEIGMEAFLGMEFGAVAGQVGHLHLIRVFGQPLLHRFAVMRDLPLVELALVRPNHLASALVLFGRTEPACIFWVHENTDHISHESSDDLRAESIVVKSSG